MRRFADEGLQFADDELHALLSLIRMDGGRLFVFADNTPKVLSRVLLQVASLRANLQPQMLVLVGSLYGIQREFLMDFIRSSTFLRKVHFQVCARFSY